MDKPNRTSVFPTRPELNFAIAEDRTSWNTLIRFDHQINANHTWAVRWLREDAPRYPIVVTRSTLDSFQDETDLDQTAVTTLTSVIGGSRVNTFRIARTWEHWWHGNECFRAQGGNGSWTGFAFGEENNGNHSPRASGSPASSMTRAARWCGRATASSTTGPSSATSTTPSRSRSSPRR